MKSYVFKVIVTEVVAFFLTYFCAGLLLSFVYENFGYSYSDFVGAYCVAMIPALWLGWRYAAKNELPGTFAKRYWPVLTPPIFLLAWAMSVFTSRTYVGTYPFAGTHTEAFYAYTMLAFSTVPFMASFVLSARRKKLESTKGLRFTCAVVVIAFALPAWQVKRLHDNYYENTLPYKYDGPTIAGEETYEAPPLPELDFSPSLSLSEDLPKLDGATSFYPVYGMIAQKIYRGNENWKDSLSFSRTEEAYNRLIRGETDLIFVLQPSDEQLRAARDAGVELRLTPIAKEAFVFFVSERNPVSNLSIGQIQDIYLKKITNWKEVGGDNEKILPFQRPENSGSQTAMVKEVMKENELPPPLQAEYSRTMGATVLQVADYRDYPGAIGYSFRFFTLNMVRYSAEYRYGYYSPLARAEGRVKLLSVDGVAPTVENIRNGSYPFTTDVFVATAGTKNPHVQELIDWILSPEGQALIEKVGYVGIGSR
ncbi:MAG: PstS family phosphate ABC transporter substrate-binding protein [Synergistaceae bacterium]|jgi:phosphate transport system substrate-binding protein|nr:PstS family phosphate ABC transporter substrate-binding protein [Synergistaceae bacterium]